MDIDKTTYRSPNYYSAWQIQNLFGVERDVKVLVIHDTEGTFPSDVEYLCATNRKNLTSAHYYIRRDGKIYELVSPDNAAWQCGVDAAHYIARPDIRALLGTVNQNIHSIGIELEALRGQAKTAAQYAALHDLTVALMARFPGIVLDRNHIVGHNEISSLKVDPAPFEWAAYMASVQAAQPVPVPAPPVELQFPQTGCRVQGGFLEFFQVLGGVPHCGYPLTNEEPEAVPGGGTITVQYFENCRFEYWASNPPGQRVRLGAVGRMYLQRIGRIR